MGDRIKKNILLKEVISILILFTPLIWSAEFENDFVKVNSTLSNGKNVSVSVKKISLSVDFPYRKAFMWGGDETRMPTSVLAEMNLMIDSDKIFVPLSAFSDLGNPKQIFIERNKDEFAIVITGGGSSTSYKAVLFFNDICITRRKVILSEFPDQVWEETNYSFNQGDQLDPISVINEFLPDSVKIVNENGEKAIEFCPDNTCELFVAKKEVSEESLEDFVYLYLYFISDYYVLNEWRKEEGSVRMARTILSKQDYENCIGKTDTEKAHSFLEYLARGDKISLFDVRYDENYHSKVKKELSEVLRLRE